MAMLPRRNPGAPSLAELMPNCLAALSGSKGGSAPSGRDRVASNDTSGFPDTAPRPLLRVSKPLHAVVVVLVDGLGAIPLAARAGHARTLMSRLGAASTIMAPFPTTTGAVLATLMTGQGAAIHGMVGYSVLDPATRTVFNHLSGWKAGPEPESWQACPTVFEQAAQLGVAAYALGDERYAASNLTRAILRGANYVSVKSHADRVREVRRILKEKTPSLVYVYVSELDVIGHAKGTASEKWAAALEGVDRLVADLADVLGGRDGLVVTADHGMIDIPRERHVYVDASPKLLDEVEFVAGEPRCLQLHLRTGAGSAQAERVLERWREAEGERSWVLSRAEALEAGLFGQGSDPAVVPRIGDVLVAARANIAYYDRRSAKPQSLDMVGQHGSLSPEESKIPLLTFGAFEN